jgi:hypothetical protein
MLSPPPTNSNNLGFVVKGKKYNLVIVLYLWSVYKCLCNFMGRYFVCDCNQLPTHKKKSLLLRQKNVLSMIWLLLPVFDWPKIHNDWSRWFAISNPHIYSQSHFQFYGWVGFAKKLKNTTFCWKQMVSSLPSVRESPFLDLYSVLGACFELILVGLAHSHMSSS